MTPPIYNNAPLPLVFFGSGAFGLPTLQRLVSRPEEYAVRLVVTQPDRPAGRKRVPSPTPIAAWASEHGLPVYRCENVNTAEAIARVRAAESVAFVVIAFGQKLSRSLIGETFAINLHGSLLPKYRGAAPINWAIINGETTTGISVITLADRMDAGLILASAGVRIQAMETAGELHDRLSVLGPDLIETVLEQWATNALKPVRQEEGLVLRAPKLRKEDGTVDFGMSCLGVRARIHGLNPWPGCTVLLGEDRLKIGLVRDRIDLRVDGVEPGTVLPGGGTVACGRGAVEILRIQAPGGRMLGIVDFLNGYKAFQPGTVLRSATTLVADEGNGLTDGPGT